MELQVLRYAAVVSVMTFDKLVSIYARYLKVLGEEDQETSSLCASRRRRDSVSAAIENKPLHGTAVGADPPHEDG